MADPFDGRVYFRLLAAVAAADGDIHDAERERFQRLLKAAAVDPVHVDVLCDEALTRRDDPLWFLGDTEVSFSQARVAVRDALVLAAIDGWSSAAELAVIEDFAERVGAASLLTSLPELNRDNDDTLAMLGDAGLDETTAEVDRGLAAARPPRDRPGHDVSIYFRLLAAVAAADEQVLESEVSRFEKLLELFGADPKFARPLCREAMLRRANPLWFLERIDPLSGEFADQLLRDASAIAQADGSLSEEERALLAEAAKRVGLGNFALPDSDEITITPDVTPPTASETRTLDTALFAASGATVVAGGAWILLGGPAAKLAAGVATAISTGFGGWMVPLVLVLGAGLTNVVLQILETTERK
jgi:tellurite resistance protein